MHKKTLIAAAAAACSLAAILGQQTHANAAEAAHSAASAPARPAQPPGAGPTADTTVTFSVSVGSLVITAPISANLGTGTAGTTIGPTAIGNVEVFDERAALGATWTATVSSTNFTTGSGTGPEMIPAGDITYNGGPVTTTGTVTAPALPAFTLSGGSKTAVVATAINGDNTATWDPTLTVAVPASAVGGAYTGTITHSVS
jgi:hypothetical protein